MIRSLHCSALEFVHQPLPTRVVFGRGALDRLPAEIDALGLRRVLLLCSPGRKATAGEIAAKLGDRAVGVLADAREHVPADLAAQTRAAAGKVDADGYLTVGGGSAVGLGKALALESGNPLIAVPTTYAGSEMTPVWGLTDAGVKRTGRDLRVLPRTVVYDPDLTLTLLARIAVTSGMNAIAHAVEAIYAPDTTPVVTLMAREAIGTMLHALPAISATPGDVDARVQALYAAWLAGSCLAVTTMGLHHKLCHALGGALGLPHAETHTVVLPHVLAFNLHATPAAATILIGAFDTGPDPARGLWELAGRLGAPRSLRELGMAQDAIPRLIDLILADPYANPRPATSDGLHSLLSAAWSGNPPGT
jgi:maleylacetate reductase